MKTDPLNDWDTAFGQFNNLNPELRLALHRNTADLMVEEGAEEIGSSDINHRLYALYRENNKSWQAVIAFFLDYIDAYGNPS